MGPPAQSIETAAFLASLRDRTADGISLISLDGGELPVSVQLRDPSRLVFSFTERPPTGPISHSPHFAVHGLARYIPASVIGFSDPSLTRDDRLKAAWFAGHEGFALQQVLPELIRQMVESLGATRVGFVGGSSGGFAALYYSWHIPDSVAVVTNPQTNFRRYLRSPIDEYRTVCWPSLDPNAALETVIETDLCARYAERFDNTVIYLQVASDYSHLKGQFAPFVDTLPRTFTSRLIVRMENWGRQGHKPAPASIWIPWVRAALSAPDTSAASIENASGTNKTPCDLPSLSPPLVPSSRSG